MKQTARARVLLGCLQRTLAVEGGLTDGQLLGRFIVRRDDAAFAALVRRHGPMVLAVCRRVLRHTQDAEDAFQAAFLVLARKAASLSDREAVGGWLHGVACRAAWGARAAAGRRRAKEQQVKDMPQVIEPAKEDQRELLELLDRELARLPEKYRLPVVLCELEGRSRREAALQLGLPEGTLSSRLARARGLLTARLGRRGLAVTGAALGSLLAKEAGAACVPGSLVISTVRAAGGSATAAAAALAEAMMKAMLLTKVTGATWGLVLAASLSVGAVVFTYRIAAAQQPAVPTPALASPGGQPTPAPASPRPAAPVVGERDDLEALRLEVEALRRSLQATRARVQALEEEVRGQKGQPATEWPVPGGGTAPEPEKPRTVAPLPNFQVGVPPLGPNAQFLKGFPVTAYPPPAPVPPGLTPTDAPTPGLGGAPPVAAAPADATAEVEAAARRLRDHPGNPQAQAEFESAVQRLNEWARRQAPPAGK
jgi:RNA polymerase sigma factor (sigma-70 family)